MVTGGKPVIGYFTPVIGGATIDAGFSKFLLFKAGPSARPCAFQNLPGGVLVSLWDDTNRRLLGLESESASKNENMHPPTSARS